MFVLFGHSVGSNRDAVENICVSIASSSAPALHTLPHDRRPRDSVSWGLPPGGGGARTLVVKVRPPRIKLVSTHETFERAKMFGSRNVCSPKLGCRALVAGQVQASRRKAILGPPSETVVAFVVEPSHRSKDADLCVCKGRLLELPSSGDLQVGPGGGSDAAAGSSSRCLRFGAFTDWHISPAARERGGGAPNGAWQEVFVQSRCQRVGASSRSTHTGSRA